MKKIILFCFVLVVSCQTEKNTHSEFPGEVIIKHDIEKIDAIPLEGKDALFDYKIVQLETDDNSLLAEISQLEIVDNHIYIFDQKGQSVKKFT
ncbi:MAG: 6-bladed beta-propeller, partial [Tannerella sp.]|nr:6-bladed beta-propeller [Tannerella sp.]